MHGRGERRAPADHSRLLAADARTSRAADQGQPGARELCRGGAGGAAAFKEAEELEYTAYTALLLYDLPETMQATLNLSPVLSGHFRPMALDLCKNLEDRTGWVAAKWGVWRDTQVFPSEVPVRRFSLLTDHTNIRRGASHSPLRARPPCEVGA